jgi:hypothetical protein
MIANRRRQFMNKRQVNRTYRIISRTLWLGILIITPFYLSVPAAVGAVGPGRPVNNVIDNWIAVIQTQCDRRLYTQAEESLARVKQYQTYFNEQQQKKIDELSEEINQSISEKAHLLKNTDVIGLLIEEGEFLKARALLHEAVKSEVLSDEERNRMKLNLGRVEAKIDEQKQLMKDLYKRSQKEYKKGNFEEARQGFAIVASSGLYVPAMGKTAEGYLAEIGHQQSKMTSDNKIVADSKPSPAIVPAEQQNPGTQQPDSPPVPGGERFGNEIQRNSKDQNDIRKSYVRAVMLDAQIKVTMHVGKAEFSLAKVIIQNARTVLQKYRTDIGEVLYRQHSDTLLELSRMIDEQQMKWELRWDTKDSGL